jgi:hypothetical protein
MRMMRNLLKLIAGVVLVCSLMLIPVALFANLKEGAGRRTTVLERLTLLGVLVPVAVAAAIVWCATGPKSPEPRGFPIEPIVPDENAVPPGSGENKREQGVREEKKEDPV